MIFGGLFRGESFVESSRVPRTCNGCPHYEGSHEGGNHGYCGRQNHREVHLTFEKRQPDWCVMKLISDMRWERW